MKEPLLNKVAVGEFAVTELLKHHSKSVIRIIVKSNSEKKKYTKYNVPILVDERYINKIVKKEDIYALAEFTPFITTLDKNKIHILINNLDDEGELGTILRTAVAFSYFDVAIINCNVDLFSNKLIRASTGAIFMMNTESFKNKKEYLKKYQTKTIEFSNKNAPLSLEVGASLSKL
ncbi:MAG: hypothetical protein MJ213_00985 [Bacilli bacterium]|nr:hypothetical protein [Bacilli bacterium]